MIGIELSRFICLRSRQLLWERLNSARCVAQLKFDLEGMTQMDDAARIQDSDALHAEFERLGVRGLWQPVPQPPKPVPRLWRWQDIHPILMDAARVINLGNEAHRRFVRLQTLSQTMSFGYQIVMPGEKAAAHRHSASAVRFVVEGRGAYTTSNGEPMRMERGDLLTQPNWVWHDHTNDSQEPMIWVDALDVGLMRTLGTWFAEDWPDGEFQPLIRPEGYSNQRYGAARSPIDRDWAVPFHYKWSDTERTLQLMADSGGVDPYDGVLLNCANPVTGQYTIKSFGCFIQMLLPGQKTKAHRHTGMAIYQVHAGTGVTVVGDDERVPLEWQDRDAFVVPSWHTHYHQNLSDTPAYLFSVTDRPIIEAAGCYREDLL
jgi:gentisate 1,2-dioxygenase